MRSKSIELATGVTLDAVDRGDPDGPAVVFLPGPTDGWRSYQPVLDHLPDGLRCVAVSQRGHGASDKPVGSYRVEDFAADVPALLDALAIDRATLVGHSGSCFTARRVALDHPERVHGLVLEASPSTLRGHPALAALVGSIEDPIDPAFARAFVTDTSSADLDDDLVEALVADVLAVPPRVWRALFGALADHDDLDELPGLAAPTLLVWGDADQLVDLAMQEDLLGRLPDASLVVHRGAGHTPRWEDPSRFATDVAHMVLG